MSDPVDQGQHIEMAGLAELSRSVSHEATNLLCGVLGQAELALLSRDPARMILALERILEDARNLRSMHATLAALAPERRPGSVGSNIAETLRALERILGRTLRKRGVELELRVARDLPAVRCGAGTTAAILHEILRPLLSGASRPARESAIDETGEWARRAASAEARDETARCAKGPSMSSAYGSGETPVRVVVEAAAGAGGVLLGVNLEGLEPSEREDVPGSGQMPWPGAAAILADRVGGSLVVERRAEGGRIEIRLPLADAAHALACAGEESGGSAGRFA